jgi:hypothetical protein
MVQFGNKVFDAPLDTPRGSPHSLFLNVIRLADFRTQNIQMCTQSLNSTEVALAKFATMVFREKRQKSAYAWIETHNPPLVLGLYLL